MITYDPDAAKAKLGGLTQSGLSNMTTGPASILQNRMQDAAQRALAKQQKQFSGALSAVMANFTGGQSGYGGVTGMPLSMPSGNVASWINQALKATGYTGRHHDALAAGLANMIQRESGGNPYAINRWDSNAQAGHPSQGLMQTIPSTFAAHMLPGHGNILNPVDNIIAGLRYAIGRYGKGMVEAGGRRDSHGNYIGY